MDVDYPPRLFEGSSPRVGPVLSWLADRHVCAGSQPLEVARLPAGSGRGHRRLPSVDYGVTWPQSGVMTFNPYNAGAMGAGQAFFARALAEHPEALEWARAAYPGLSLSAQRWKAFEELQRRGYVWDVPQYVPETDRVPEDRAVEAARLAALLVGLAVAVIAAAVTHQLWQSAVGGALWGAVLYGIIRGWIFVVRLIRWPGNRR